MKYAVIVEEGPTSFGAHVPDLPGCVAVVQRRGVKRLEKPGRLNMSLLPGNAGGHIL